MTKKLIRGKALHQKPKITHLKTAAFLKADIDYQTFTWTFPSNETNSIICSHS